jgi:hypothetical protein
VLAVEGGQAVRGAGVGGQYLDGAGGGAAVAGLGVADGDRYLGPGQGVERGEEPGLVVLDGEDESRAVVVQVSGVGV